MHTKVMYKAFLSISFCFIDLFCCVLDLRQRKNPPLNSSCQTIIIIILEITLLITPDFELILFHMLLTYNIKVV